MKAPKGIDFSDKMRTITVKQANIKAALFYQGTDIVAYKVWYKGKLLFAGNDYRPGMGISIDSKESIVNLLGFFTVKLDDTDEDYFKNYTQEQLDWLETDDIDELNLFVNDWQENYYDKKNKN